MNKNDVKSYNAGKRLFQNNAELSSLSWSNAYTGRLHRTSPRNSTGPPMSRPISVSTLFRHHRLLSDALVFQTSAIELFRSLLDSRKLWNTLPSQNVTSAPSLAVLQETPINVNLMGNLGDDDTACGPKFESLIHIIGHDKTSDTVEENL